MTTLSQGSSATITVGDNGYVSVATNGGFASVVITPTVGSVQTISIGPSPWRQKFGPFTEGASVVLSNQSCGAFDYDYNAADGGLTAAQVAATQALVSVAGNLAAAAVSSTSGTPGEVRRISDGDNAGALVVWAIPQGASTYTWCWWLWPQSAY